MSASFENEQQHLRELTDPETARELREEFDLNRFRGRRWTNLLKAVRVTWHRDHTPGQIIEMSRNRRYRVAPDGSYRKF